MMIYRQLPNQLTLARLVLAGVFFLVLNQYRYAPRVDPHTAVIWWSIVLFLLAALTDWLDGYLARKWKVESRFGRIMDPVCDKVLILGAFIYLAGPRFVIPEAAAHLEYYNMITGVYPWMVVVILSRELLVTAIRSEVEVNGTRFGANLWGKLKMILQSAVVPLVLLFVWLDPQQPGREWIAWTRDVLVYLTVIVTIASGLPYVTGAIRASRKRREV